MHRSPASSITDHWLGRFAPDTASHLHAERYLALLGRETSLVDGARSLAAWVKSMRMPAVGAHLITCSDESEQETAHAFERHFARHLLPSLRSFDKAVFRTANLGARYEWGSLGVGEEHYARAKNADAGKVHVVKLHAHVATEIGPSGPRFGEFHRYAKDGSAACGALSALMSGARSRPFLLELEETFGFEGADRVSRLREVDESLRPLVAAIVSVRLQARRAFLDVQESRGASPTAYLVVASVTLNRTGKDTELPVGLYLADHLTEERREHWIGVTDDPRSIQVQFRGSEVAIEHRGLKRQRAARDHRALLREAFLEGEVGTEENRRTVLARIQALGDEHPVAKATLKTLAPLLLELAPVPAAAAMFGVGALSIHHTAKAHRLLDEARSDAVARRMLESFHEEVERLTPEQAERALALLRHELAQDQP